MEALTDTEGKSLEIIGKFYDDFLLVKDKEGAIEIMSESDCFDILCAEEAHPYCPKSEFYFSLSYPFSPESIQRNVEVCIFLRNRRDRSVKEVRLKADVGIKTTGIPNAIILEPAELRGLVCGKSFIPGDPRPWIVFRPFKIDNLRPPLDKESGIVKTFLAESIGIQLPHVGVDDDQSSNENMKIAGQGIATIPELSKLFDTTELWLDSRDPGKSILDHEFPLLDSSANGAFAEQPAVLLTESPFKWPNKGHELPILPGDEYLSAGYRQFSSGVVKAKGGKFYFVPDHMPSIPESVGGRLYVARPNPTKEIAHSTHDDLETVAGFQ